MPAGDPVNEFAGVDAQIHDAIEYALWQDLADALTRLEEQGLDPHPDTSEIDAGSVVHGGGHRGGGYKLSHTARGWTVESRGAA